jgi:hypothetical protein
VINMVEIRLLVPRKGHGKKPDHDASTEVSAE